MPKVKRQRPGGHEPVRVRQCVVSRELKPEAELIRFVIDPEGRVVADFKRRLPGRGVWVTADRRHLETAVRKNLFARGFRRNVKVAKKLPQTVAEQYEGQVRALLSLANKAGELTTGFERVAEEIARGRACVLIHAIEAGEDGCRKLDGRFLANCGAKAQQRIWRLHRIEHLSMAIGRENVVHAALKAGGLCEKYHASACILQRLQGC